jgi:hypothetical protein
MRPDEGGCVDLRRSLAAHTKLVRSDSYALTRRRSTYGGAGAPRARAAGGAGALRARATTATVPGASSDSGTGPPAGAGGTHSYGLIAVAPRTGPCRPVLPRRPGPRPDGKTRSPRRGSRRLRLARTRPTGAPGGGTRPRTRGRTAGSPTLCQSPTGRGHGWGVPWHTGDVGAHVHGGCHSGQYRPLGGLGRYP